MTEIYLLCHAQTELNPDRKLIGGRGNHLPLSDAGRPAVSPIRRPGSA